MERLKKCSILFLAVALIVSSLYVVQPQKVMAADSFVIRVEGTNKYLYSGTRNWIMAKEFDSSDRAFYWTVTNKGGYYWIQNKKDGKYMCLETNKDETGIAVVNQENYDNWQSGRWALDLSKSTTIRNLWKGDSGYLALDTNDTYSRVYFGTKQGKFVFEEKTPTIEGYTEPNKTGGIADKIVIPKPNTNTSSIGATMPYTRYDSQDAAIGGGATIKTSPTIDKTNIASQASCQSYVELPSSGSYAEWTMETTGDGVTMRFTMPDSSDGNGKTGSLDVYVNGVKKQTVALSSYNMWQYFNGSSLEDTSSNGATPCFAFDEVHFKLDQKLNKGDKIRIQSSGASSLVYGVDFLEIEEVPVIIKKPDNALSITDYGAIPNDGLNDSGAISRCMGAAKAQGKDVYFPEGTFEMASMWKLGASDMKITGAGMWYTNLMFTNSNQSGGGISGNTANNVEFCNMYINSKLSSRYGENAIYKCFMDIWTGGCYIHDIWEDHFECGFWLANYGNNTVYDDGIKIVNCRIRNNFADGVNFCKGTSNAVVYNCDVRNNGDDGLAMWNYSNGAKDEFNNILCYNTIEFIWRAGGIAIYGGTRHQIYNNYIADTFLASGIHLNTVFSGHKFTNNDDGITFSNNILVRSGSRADVYGNDFGAIDIMSGVRNITFNNTYIFDSQHDAVELSGSPSGIVFNNLQIFGTGIDGQTTSRTNKGAAFKFPSATGSQPVTINGFTYGNIANDSAFFGERTSCTITKEVNKGKNAEYTVLSGKTKTSGSIDININDNTEKESSTQKPTEKPTILKKAKVSKVYTKKKSSKKIKIKIKKFTGAKIYRVQVSKKNSFKKKNILLDKTSKKLTKTFSSKKFKNKKKLYVRVMAYKYNGKKKVAISKWSKAVKAKIVK
jgi:hypothetical protein